MAESQRAASRGALLTGVAGILQHRDSFVVALIFSAWHREFQKVTIEDLAHDCDQESRIVDFLSEQAVKTRARSHSPQPSDSRKPCVDSLQIEAKCAEQCKEVEIEVLHFSGEVPAFFKRDEHLQCPEQWGGPEGTSKSHIPQTRTSSASTCASEQDIAEALDAIKIDDRNKALDVNAINSKGTGDASTQEIVDVQHLCNERVRILNVRPTAIPTPPKVSDSETHALEQVDLFDGLFFSGCIASFKDDHFLSADESGCDDLKASCLYACPMLTNGSIQSVTNGPIRSEL